MTPLLDVDRVRVLLAGNTVGMLTMSPSRTLAFAYDKTWLTHGFSISPISLPLRDGVFVAQRDPLNGMFGVFDDSMPDGWGTTADRPNAASTWHRPVFGRPAGASIDRRSWRHGRTGIRTRFNNRR